MSAESEIDKLAKFLLERFPNEIGKGRLPQGESAVDIAIRILSSDFKEV